MAETVVINIEANTQGLQSTIDLLVKLGQVEKSVADNFRKTNEANVKSLQQGFTQTTGQYQKLDGAIKNVGKDNKLAEGLDATAPLVKTTNSLQQFKKELKEAEAQVFQLRQQFGDLDPQVLAAAEKVVQLRKGVDDTNKIISAVDPGAKFKAIENLGGAIAGVFQVATGALQAFGVESEQATKVAQQFQGALNIFSGLQQLSQFKDSLTAVRAALGLTAVAQKGVAVGNTVAGTTATGAAGAFRALTAAMVANPYLAIIAGLVAIGGALVALTDDSEEVAAAIEDIKTEFEGLQDVLNQDLTQLDQQAQLNVSAIDLQIAKRKQEGASVAEIRELERERFKEQGLNIAKSIQKNEEFLSNSQKEIDKLQLLDDEKSQQEIKNIKKKVTETEQANKKLANDALIYNNQLAKFDVETTKIIQDDADKQREARKSAAEANYNKLISQNADLFARERLEVQKTIKEETELRTRLARLTLEEKEKQLAINQKYGKSTISIEQEIFDIKSKLTADEIATRTKLVKEGLDQDLKNLDTYLKDSVDAINNNYDERELATRANTNRELQANLEALQKGLINFEEYEKKKNEIVNRQPDLSQERAIAIAENELKVLETRKQNLQDYGENTVQIEKDIANKKTDIQNLTTAKELTETEKRLANEEAAAKEKIEIANRVAELTKSINEQIGEESKNLLFQGLTQAFESELENINKLKDEQLAAIDEENEKIQEAYDNRLIGKRQLELEQERLTKERVKAEEQAEKRINAIRKKQDIALKAKALFEIFLNTRRAVTAIQADPTIPTISKPPLISTTIILGGIQAAAVLAQPLPKYKKGTLAVMGKSEDISYQGGRGTMRVVGSGSEDTELALLQPGEAVIPTDTNRKYHPAIKAIYENKIKPQDINQFVTMKLRGDISRDAKADGPIMAKMDISDLYALGRIMKKNDGVTVKNIKELASIFADSYNPRR